MLKFHQNEDARVILMAATHCTPALEDAVAAYLLESGRLSGETIVIFSRLPLALGFFGSVAQVSVSRPDSLSILKHHGKGTVPPQAQAKLVMALSGSGCFTKVLVTQLDDALNKGKVPLCL